MARRIGQLEAAALAYVQMRGLQTVRTGDLQAALHITSAQERALLGRMARSGMVARVRNGLYLFPPRLPLGGVWTPDDAMAIDALMGDKGAGYQITGPSAFSRYRFDEQIPSRIFMYNDALSGEREVGGVRMTLIKVSPERLGDAEQVDSPSGPTLVYSSRVRTLVDAVRDWARFDSLPRAYRWIREEIEAERITPGELARSTIRYGNRGTIRRVGALLDRMDVDPRILNRLQRALRPSQSKILLVPERPARGLLLKRWGTVIND
jgi:predicted transcriptional regulator of viral defense system